MSANDISRKLVFVIDDEQVIARTLAIILQRAGYITEFFCSAEQALEAGTERRPDLIVTDVMLNGMSGVHLAEVIADSRPDVPVLLISGQAETSRLVEEARQRGFNFYVHPKPMLPFRLLTEVARLISISSTKVHQLAAAEARV